MITSAEIRQDRPAALQRSLGWMGFAAAVVYYIGLVAFNFWLPLESSPVFYYNHYTSRLWSWTEHSVGIFALAVLVVHWKRIPWRFLPLSALLIGLNGWSKFLRNGSVTDALLEAGILAAAFLAGIALFQDNQKIRVNAFSGGLGAHIRSILLGIALSIPLAAVNTLFFYFSSGPAEGRSLFRSAVLALQPGISEEIIYRFFIMAVAAALLASEPRRRLVMTAVLLLGVVPHSLNHLPHLFLQSPGQAVFMLAATSLLFGLPMALIQLRKNLEAAIGFHWAIDFVRFVFGY